jgi:hypothetical protein
MGRDILAAGDSDVTSDLWGAVLVGSPSVARRPAVRQDQDARRHAHGRPGPIACSCAGGAAEQDIGLDRPGRSLIEFVALSDRLRYACGAGS